MPTSYATPPPPTVAIALQKQYPECIATQTRQSRRLLPKLHRTPLLVLLVVVASAVFLAVTPWMMSEPDHRHLFGDDGPVELISELLWVFLAGVAFGILRPIWQKGLAGAALALACAAREASWHKQFTDDESVLKPGFFLDFQDVGIVPKLIAGVAVLILLWSVIIVSISCWQRASRDGWFRASWVQTAAIGLITLAISKVFDRAPGIITDFRDVDMEYPLRGVLYALEEGLELLLPIIFIIALITAHRSRGK
ncbi:MAG: hypothetical protein EA380_00280 [Phycisphaeraceae bacterium]|nr:MAG: hypothetical protein EA380_00280 [Phycisphaeraceae bacterium]